MHTSCILSSHISSHLISFRLFSSVTPISYCTGIFDDFHRPAAHLESFPLRTLKHYCNLNYLIVQNKTVFNLLIPQRRVFSVCAFSTAHLIDYLCISNFATREFRSYCTVYADVHAIVQYD